MATLYLKTHNKTGLKYLGKTIRKDIEKYKGGGVYWNRHINKHGYDVTTAVLLQTECKSELKETGIFFSKLWNIVESKEYANLVEEMGAGGSIKGETNHSYGKKLSNSHKNNISQAQIGNKHSMETRTKQSVAHIGILHEKTKCPHCNKIGGIRALKRWHFNNCRYINVH